MVMTYTSLTGSTTTDGSIAQWLNHGSLTAVSDTIVMEAESYIYRRLRHWRMITSTTGNFTSNPGGQPTVTDYIPLPGDYLEDVSLLVTGTSYQIMFRKTLQEIMTMYGFDGNGNRVVQQPMYYFSDQMNIKFDSPPDSAYPYLLYYYQQPAALSSTGTNFLTTTYPRLVRCACMASASEFMKDSGTGNYDRTYWLQQTDSEIMIAQIESDRQQRSLKIGMILE